MWGHNAHRLLISTNSSMGAKTTYAEQKNKSTTDDDKKIHFDSAQTLLFTTLNTEDVIQLIKTSPDAVKEVVTAAIEGKAFPTQYSISQNLLNLYNDINNNEGVQMCRVHSTSSYFRIGNTKSTKDLITCAQGNIKRIIACANNAALSPHEDTEMKQIH